MSFKEFYGQVYLPRHDNYHCLLMHVLGFWLCVAVITVAIAEGLWLALVAVPVISYGLAWSSHLVYAHNTPASFDFKDSWLAPVYSMLGYILMNVQVLFGRIPKV